MIPLTERRDPVAAPAFRVEVSRDPVGVAWELLEASSDREVAEWVLCEHESGLPHGALVRVVERGRTIALRVADAARGALVEVPDGPRLVALWESDDAPAMLRASTYVDRRRLVLIACDCAETVLHLVPAGEERPRRAVETAREWARGRATSADVWAAALFAAYATTAEAAAYTAARCAAAAGAARAAAADYAADYAAAAVARAAAARAAADATTSDADADAAIVRRHIPLAVVACARVGARDPLPVAPP